MKNIISKTVVTVILTALATTASAESIFVRKTSTPTPVRTSTVEINYSFFLKRGIQNYLEGDYTTASMLLHRALRNNPSDGVGNYYMGLTKVKIGNDRGALPYLKLANQIFPNAPQSYEALGAAYAKSGQTKKAQRVLSELDSIKTCAENCASSADIESARMIIKSAIGQ